MRPGTVADLSIERLGWSGPLPPGWEESYYTYTDFTGFMEQLTPRFPGRPDEYARIAAECFEDLAALNVMYAEVSFDGIIREAGKDSRFWPIMEALEDERVLAEERFGMRLSYIVGLMRSLPVEVAMERVHLAAIAHKQGMGVVGIDLHGDERIGPPELFNEVYAVAEQAGLGLRVHAGEALGPDSVRSAVALLGVDRIAHGVRAVEDPKLLERLRHGPITFELCPTSNVRTGIVPSFKEHPIRLFHDLGIPVTVNSDDPLPFFTNIERECRILVEELDFTCEELKHIMLNAAHAAFTSEAERQQLSAVIETEYTGVCNRLSQSA